MLHITNGDSVGGTLRLTGLGGEILAWKDVLHEGPVPEDLPLEELSAVRARFVAGRGWGDFDEVMADFRLRDEALHRFAGHEEVVLWFEHDLYDQLQLIQLLDWFSSRSLHRTRLSLICIGEYPGMDKFYGLGTLNPGQLEPLFGMRQPVSAAQLESGRRAWSAFRSPDPASLLALLAQALKELPFLESALIRFLQEYPSTANGLSRTEQEILEIASAGPVQVAMTFVKWQELEEAPFLGDSTFFDCVTALANGPERLLQLDPEDASGRPAMLRATAALTGRGREVMDGRADWMEIRGIDRWFGGVHLTGHNPVWRWDPERRSLVDRVSR